MVRFLTKAHRDRYEALALELVPPGRDPFGYLVPAEWAACLFLLTAHERLWAAVRAHVHPGMHEIHWYEVRRGVLSSGERFLFDLAIFLFNCSGAPEWDALWNTLDSTNFELAVAALQIRRHGEEIIDFDE